MRSRMSPDLKEKKEEDLKNKMIEGMQDFQENNANNQGKLV